MFFNHYGDDENGEGDGQGSVVETGEEGKGFLGGNKGGHSRDGSAFSFGKRRKFSKGETDGSVRHIIENDAGAQKALDKLRKKAVMNLDVDRTKLDELAVLLRKKLSLTKHRRLIHSYADSFKGSEAVAWLVANSICTDPQDAKNMMRHLLYRRIILRVDHTKPIFNSLIHSVVPSVAQWRKKKQLQWYQDGAKSYNMAALYSFNISAFAQYKLVVRMIGGKGLRYTRHNTLTGKWEMKKIAPLGSVSLGKVVANTSVEEKTSEPRWDETFYFDFDKDLPAHEELWIKVFDFREIGESFELGVCCLQTSEILKQCGVVGDVIPPTDVADAPGWLAWHPLVPPVSALDPDEVRGGELHLEFQILTNVVDTADETVHDECRPDASAFLLKQTVEDSEDILTANKSRGGDAPKTVVKYQHLDRRPTEVIEARKPLGSPSSPSNEPGGANPAKPVSNIWQKYDRYSLHVSSIEIRGVTDIPAGTVVWLEFAARSSRRSQYLTNKKRNNADSIKLAAGVKKAATRVSNGTADTGIIARKRSPLFTWPSDGRMIVNAGSACLPIPTDVLKYTTVEVRIVKRGDISRYILGKGRLPLYQVRKLDIDEVSSGEEDGDTIVGSDDEGAAAEMTAEDKRKSFRSQVDQSTKSFAASESLVSIGDDEVPDADELPFQKPVNRGNPDAKVIVLRKQAAFKRNIKIKSGQVYCYCKLRPLLDDDDLWDEEDSFLLDEEADGSQHVDIEDALRSVVGNPGEIPTPIKVPDPLTNVYIDETINGSVVKLATMLLGTDSKFAAAFAKDRKNTEIEAGSWQLPAENVAEIAQDESKSDVDDADGGENNDASEDDGEQGGKNTGEEDLEEEKEKDTGDALEESGADDQKKKSQDDENENENENDDDDDDVGGSNADVKEELAAPKSLLVSEPKFGSGRGKEQEEEDGEDEDEDEEEEEKRPRSLSDDAANQLGTKSGIPSLKGVDSLISMDVASNHVNTVSNPKRVITFMLPPSALTKASKCTETQEILVMQPGGFVFESTSETPDVPYGDKFSTKAQVVVTYLSDKESRLRISGEPVWKDKPPFVKGFIMSGVKNGHTEAYTAQVAMLKEWLAPKRKAKSKKKKPEISVEKKSEEKTKMSTKKKILYALALLTIILCFLGLCYFLYTNHSDKFVEIWLSSNDKLLQVFESARVAFE